MNYLGSIKYEGKLVEDGVIDAFSAAQALTGINDAFHYFIAQENPAMGDIDIPLPVEIKKGSWEALIPDSITSWIITAGGIGATTYITTAARKLAENGFKDETIKTLAVKALSLIQQFIKLGKHLGHIEFKKVSNVRWDEAGAIITNDRGETLHVPTEDWNKLAKAPSNIISKIAHVIEEERSLTVSTKFGRISSEVTVTKREKFIFTKNDESELEVQFPDFIHGASATIEGVVTRENGRTKTLGFLYDNHILTCIPATGDMLPYKKHLFLTCRMTGTISRIDETGQPNAKKPKIIFTNLEIISNREQMDLNLNIDDDEA